VPASEETLTALAELSENHAVPEICDHLFIYREGAVLLSWPDFPDPKVLMISDAIAEATVARFSSSLGTDHKRIANPCGPV
jgi:hypothetical protein